MSPSTKKTNRTKKSSSRYLSDKLPLGVTILGSLLIALFITQNQVLRQQLFHEQASVPANVHSYIVVFQDSEANPDVTTQDMVKTHGLGLKHIYHSALKGYAAVIPDSELENVKKDPRVKFVSIDGELNIASVKPPTRKATPTPVLSPTPVSSQTVPSGVLRIGRNTTNKGAGIGVAVLDTGVDLTHPDLATHIVTNTSCVTGVTTGTDDNGHGTHVAGIIGAIDNAVGVVGVAPSVNLIAVKVFNSQGTGSWSDVICGIDWVNAHAASLNIKVVNLSITGGGSSDNNCGNTNSDALHQAICRSSAQGITYVAAAGNASSDVSNYIPAAYDDTVITVSSLIDTDGKPGGLGNPDSTGPDDTFASYSNFGLAIDFGAPGDLIYSTKMGGGYDYFTGTSEAAPHVAGAAALYLYSHPTATWTQVRDGLKAVAEPLGQGHTDPSGKHPEPVVKTGLL